MGFVLTSCLSLKNAGFVSAPRCSTDVPNSTLQTPALPPRADLAQAAACCGFELHTQPRVRRLSQLQEAAAIPPASAPVPTVSCQPAWKAAAGAVPRWQCLFARVAALGAMTGACQGPNTCPDTLFALCFICSFTGFNVLCACVFCACVQTCPGS